VGRSILDEDVTSISSGFRGWKFRVATIAAMPASIEHEQARSGSLAPFSKIVGVPGRAWSSTDTNLDST